MKDSRNSSGKYVNKSYDVSPLKHLDTFAPNINQKKDSNNSRSLSRNEVKEHSSKKLDNHLRPFTNQQERGRQTDMGYRTINYNEDQRYCPMNQSMDTAMGYQQFEQAYPRYNNMSYNMYQSCSPEPTYQFNRIPTFVDAPKMMYQQPYMAKSIINESNARETQTQTVAKTKIPPLNLKQVRKRRAIPKSKIVVNHEKIQNKIYNYKGMIKNVS